MYFLFDINANKNAPKSYALTLFLKSIIPRSSCSDIATIAVKL